MAYTPATLSQVIAIIGGAAAGQSWLYITAADADATIVGAGYFSDGYAKGMKVGDIVDARATTGPKQKFYQVSAVSSSTGTATVTAITAIT